MGATVSLHSVVVYCWGVHQVSLQEVTFLSLLLVSMVLKCWKGHEHQDDSAVCAVTHGRMYGCGDDAGYLLQVLSHLEESIRGDGFANKMQRARECPHSEQGSEELDALLDGFVVVSKEDAVDAMASYLAAWLSSVPEAQNMDPKKLQHALLTTVKVSPLP